MRLFFLHIQPEHGKKALETKSDDSVDSQPCGRAGIISTFLKNSKYSKISPYSLGAILLIIAAVLLRVVLISNGWPKIDSDEATMGLSALHILTRGERPIFFYGQNYNGTLEAYLGACFFAIFGPSSFALRLGLVVLYVGSLLALYLLACLLYTRGIALATVFLLCLGSNYTFTLELSAYGEYLDTLFFGTLSLLLACWLALSFHSDMDSREQRKRLAAYACLGGVIGLGLWSDMLILPFVYTSLLLLIIFCHRELRTQASIFGLLGFLIGAFPLLIFNIEHPSHNSLSTLLALYRSGATSRGKGTFELSILGAIIISIPMMTSAYPLCPNSLTPVKWIHQLSPSCIGFQGSWGLGIIIIWMLAMTVASKELWKQHLASSTAESPAQKEQFVRYTGRLMLLATAGLTTLAYVTSPAPAVVPATSARYLIGLLATTPAIVAFLWPKLSLGLSSLPILVRVWTVRNIANIVKLCISYYIILFLIFSTINTFFDIPYAQKLNHQQNTLINTLLLLHATHIYSDYWTCDRLIFLSNEHIICMTLTTDLQPGRNRYNPYTQIVSQDPHPTYVFDTEGSNLSGTLQEKAFVEQFGTQYHRLFLLGYAIYPSAEQPYLI